jgi:hypothetical protein
MDHGLGDLAIDPMHGPAKISTKLLQVAMPKAHST